MVLRTWPIEVISRGCMDPGISTWLLYPNLVIGPTCEEEEYRVFLPCLTNGPKNIMNPPNLLGTS